MAVANKHELFGSHKGMWIKDIYTIWRERFPFVVEKLYSDYSAGSTPDLTYTEVSRLFRTKLEMEGELRRTGKSRGSMRGTAFLAEDSGEPIFMGEGVQKDKAPKRRRATTKTGSGPKKRQTKKTFDTKPCAACLHPKHPMQDCWAVIGTPKADRCHKRKREPVNLRL